MKNLNLNQNIINKNYFIDSRDVKENSVFICIKGPNNDGHNYVNYVLNNFSKTIVVCEKHWSKRQRLIFPWFPDNKTFGTSCPSKHSGLV